MMENLQEIFQQIARNENIEDAEVVYDDVASKGYVGDVKLASIRGTNKTVHLFIKTAIDKKEALDMALYLRLFRTEYVFYDQVLAAMKMYEEAADSKDQFNAKVSKCYYASDKCLVLQNLITDGFQVWKTLREAVDEDHVRMVMEGYGQYHALAYALKQNAAEKFNEYGKQGEAKSEIMLDAVKLLKPYRLFETKCERAMKAFPAEDEEKYRKSLKTFMGGLEEFLEGLINDCKYDVLVHGDCWTHNFMFKYEDGKPVEMRFLDFQLMRQGSPIIDLSYFLFTSACNAENFTKAEKYLRAYYDSLARHMKQLNVTQTVITYETLLALWAKYARYGFLMGLIINKMLIAERDEIVANHNALSPLLGFNFVSVNEELYLKRVRDSFKYLYDNNLLN